MAGHCVEQTLHSNSLEVDLKKTNDRLYSNKDINQILKKIVYYSPNPLEFDEKLYNLFLENRNILDFRGQPDRSAITGGKEWKKGKGGSSRVKLKQEEILYKKLNKTITEKLVEKLTTENYKNLDNLDNLDDYSYNEHSKSLLHDDDIDGFKRSERKKIESY